METSTMMRALYASGHIVDLILALVAVEFVILAWRRRSPRPASALIDIALTVAPGVCLLLALRAALTGAPWPLVAAWLAAALPVHIADLIRRRV
jgi:hypothetical protein